MKSIKGFKDYLPDEAAKLSKIEKTARSVFKAYGYGEIRVPVLESTDLFVRGLGQTTDIVEKEMYTFEDRDGASVSLRPEGTAGVVRAYIQNGLSVSSPRAKLFYMGPMFRREKPQKGRLRQFYQLGSEAFGSESPSLDAEVIAMIRALLDELGLERSELLVNSVGCAVCRPPYKKKLQDYLKKCLEAHQSIQSESNGSMNYREEGKHRSASGWPQDKLCSNCIRRIDTNPLRVLDCKQEKCWPVVLEAPPMTESLCDGCKAHFDSVLENLGAMAVPAKIDPRLVRGLDYYTRTAFEFVSDEIGAQSAVAAGGRYDGLVKELGGPDVPGIGFAAGMERIALIMKDETSAKSGPDIFIAPIGREASLKAMKLAVDLRKSGLWVEIEHEAGKSLNALLKRANKIKAAHALIIGEDELKSGTVKLKNLETGEQADLSPEDLLKNPEKHLSG